MMGVDHFEVVAASLPRHMAAYSCLYIKLSHYRRDFVFDGASLLMMK